ncbi:(2E,6E)-farnesyl diphosphate synthase [hydrothermal vent metagenome]|uniref:(2E,6E)-farnesyl diphosphate synthase n=1 Tax=hydrothermal vent metagenome TaxID=652676 RepID=A0A3B0VZD4_9ZZZZ
MEFILKNQLKIYQQRVNQQLQQFLEPFTKEHGSMSTTLVSAMQYATLNGGKRLRPALTYAMGDALNIPLNQLDSSASAIELIHSYSLVHDDLPAMDDDDLRRGKPTCHVQYTEATAILVGDAQQTLAFQVLSEDLFVLDRHKVRLIQLLSQASGAQGMIAGQMMDLQSEGVLPQIEQLKMMHLMKTGALINAALHMGACQSDLYSCFKENLTQYGQAIGLAFQVQDDILDIEGNSQTLGKPQGSDIEADKSTYPKLLGLKESKIYRDQLIEQAQTYLSLMPIKSVFLEQLTNYIAKREY